MSRLTCQVSALDKGDSRFHALNKDDWAEIEMYLPKKKNETDIHDKRKFGRGHLNRLSRLREETRKTNECRLREATDRIELCERGRVLAIQTNAAECEAKRLLLAAQKATEPFRDKNLDEAWRQLDDPVKSKECALEALLQSTEAVDMWADMEIKKMLQVLTLFSLIGQHSINVST